MTRSSLGNTTPTGIFGGDVLTEGWGIGEADRFYPDGGWMNQLVSELYLQ